MSPSRSGKAGTLFASVPSMSDHTKLGRPTVRIVDLEFTVALSVIIRAAFEARIVIRNGKRNSVSPIINTVNGCEGFAFAIPLNGHTLPACERGGIVRDVAGGLVHALLITRDHYAVNTNAHNSSQTFSCIFYASASRAGPAPLACYVQGAVTVSGSCRGNVLFNIGNQTVEGATILHNGRTVAVFVSTPASVVKHAQGVHQDEVGDLFKERAVGLVHRYVLASDHPSVNASVRST